MFKQTNGSLSVPEFKRNPFCNMDVVLSEQNKLTHEAICHPQRKDVGDSVNKSIKLLYWTFNLPVPGSHCFGSRVSK